MVTAADEASDLETEVAELAAAAGALLRELVEEDVVGFERLPASDASHASEAADTSDASEAVTAGPRGSKAARGAGPPASEVLASSAAAPAAAPAGRRAPSSAVGSGATVPTPGLATDVPWESRRPSLEEVRDHLGECSRCGLCGGRQTIVFGEGDPAADLMFIGEGPGEQEDRTGRPFVGRAGELLTQMIEKGIGIPRAEVYICNIVKCRPPQNRNPLPPEVAACRPFLDGQIQAVAPKVIVTLGKPAASLLLDREVAITRLRGTWQEYRGIPLMPTLHPAYVLRQYTPENRRAVWQDLQAAIERARA